MEKIIVPKPQDDSIKAQLRVLYETFKCIEPNQSVLFDLSQMDWIHPLIALPLSAYISHTQSQYTADAASHKVQSYLQTICFPKGIDAISSFQRHVSIQKNYIPISVLKSAAGVEREKLQSEFEKMVLKVLHPSSGAASAIYYPISELITNIFDHSKNDQGYIFAQFYPVKNFLDICIVDNGRGIAKTYFEEKNLMFADKEAIAEALQGHSTKKSAERGFGLRTSRDVVCTGMNGNFVIISGEAGALFSKDQGTLFSLPQFYWHGVIIGYRMPRPNAPIDISPYLE